MNRRQQRKAGRRQLLDPRGPLPWVSRAALRQARLEYIFSHGALPPVPTPGSVWRRARSLHQGQRLIVGALEASRPWTEPCHWVSEERLVRARIPQSVLAPLPYRANLALVRLPSRLYWQVRERTPDWDWKLRERQRLRRLEKLAEQLARPAPRAPEAYFIHPPVQQDLALSFLATFRSSS